jgi:hypothetical protein
MGYGCDGTEQSRLGPRSQTSHVVPGGLAHSSMADPAEYESVPLHRPTAPPKTQRVPAAVHASPSFADASHRDWGNSSHVPKHWRGAAPWWGSTSQLHTRADVAEDCAAPALAPRDDALV